MKLIEFLLEIAKGSKDLPKRIIYNYKVFELEDFLHYKHKGNEDLFDEIKYYTNVNVALNDNVEILDKVDWEGNNVFRRIYKRNE